MSATAVITPDAPAVASAPPPGSLWGLMAEFPDATSLVKAAAASRKAGYRRVDGYAPFPIHELFEALAIKKGWLPFLTLCGGLSGMFFGAFMQWWTRNVHYPMNIGGKPLNAWPMFIPITYECTILFAGLTCALSMILLNGFPCPYHPVFNVPAFARASQDGFFLTIESADDRFSYDQTKAFLESLHSVEVSEIAY